jgi:hypothetical protein
MSRTIHRRRFLALIGVIVAVLIGAAVPAGATASADATPPVIKLTLTPQFIVPSTIGPSGTQDIGAYTFNIALSVRWSAKDASGICGYDLLEDPLNDAPFYVLTNSLATHYNYLGTNYDSSFGGGDGGFRGFTLTARDCAGNAATANTRFTRPEVIQDSRTGSTDSPVSYSGKWAVAHCTCFSNTTTHFTTQKGARVSFTVTTRAQDHVAVVMEKNTNRGSAQIYLDGVLRATVNTHATRATHRQVVWQRLVARGEHVVTVVNLATSGHPRIDLDAFMYTNSFPTP